MTYKFNYFEKLVLIPLFPLYKTENANKKIFNDIQSLKQQNKLSKNGSYMGNYIGLSLTDAKAYLESTLDKKKNLEERAKSHILGVTIAVTLVTVLCKLLVDLNLMNYLIGYKLVLFIISLYVIVQMALSGLSSMKIISDITIQYELFPDDTNLPDNELLDLIALDTELNVKYNIIRNNYLSSSYESIKKSLIGLVSLFIIMTFPINAIENDCSLKKNDLIRVQHQQMDLEQEFILFKDEQFTYESITNEKLSQIEQQVNILIQDVTKMESAISDSKESKTN
jgi:hypothetical protein